MYGQIAFISKEHIYHSRVYEEVQEFSCLLLKQSLKRFAKILLFLQNIFHKDVLLWTNNGFIIVTFK